MDIKKGFVYGIGINDYSGFIKVNGDIIDSYSKWRSMIWRCYDTEFHKKEPSYSGCTVCNKWILFSNFKIWYDKNYISGYQLDKDVLIKGNKVYSPETCCFIPLEINYLCAKSKAIRGKYPIGVSFSKQKRKFISCISVKNKYKHIGLFDNAIDAFISYKNAKEAYIKEVATEYYANGKINERVYQALMKYEVAITD